MTWPFKSYMRLFRSLIIIFFFTTPFFMVHAADLKKIEQGLSDTVITTKITAKLTKNSHLNPLNIKVSTQEGIVTLRGHVNDNQSFIDVLRIANQTTGVQSVNTDELDIKQVNSSFKDAYITAKIEAAILTAKVLDDESIPLVGINASTVNGIVTLTGEVNSEQSINAILKRVHAVPGVKKIVSNLQTTLPITY